MKRFVTILLMTSVILSCLLFQGCGLLDIDNISDTILHNKELTAEEIYELVSPSVVEITGETSNSTTTGTGFFYDNKGTVITNYHVIEGCISAEITLTNGTNYKIDKVLGYDIDRDIAILSTKCTSSTPLIIRESAVKTGEIVYAIGSSLGLSGSLSDGIISAAEREFDGQIYIQTTAPISHGNSGGPLIDKEGKVIGITSASFADGQNLNLAIPIKEVSTISITNPLTLEAVFEQTGHEVEWLSDYRFQYYEEENTYVLLFQLSDKNERPMAANGAVNIRIVNDDGMIVYSQNHNFSEVNFEKWIYDEVDEMYLATIYISPSSINAGSTEYGTVFFEIYGDDYGFEECSIDAFDLPVKPVTIQLPSLPLIINDYGYFSNIQTTLRIDSITYEKVYEDSLYIYFSGEKIYDVNGKNSDSWISFEWKLYDSEDYLIDQGTFYTDSISVGDKFKDKDVFIADGIKAGEHYRLVIVVDDDNNQSRDITEETSSTQLTCSKLMCSNVVTVSGAYCAEHKCVNETCIFERDYNSQYCSVCQCLKVGCKNPKITFGYYCEEHTCDAIDCTSEKQYSSNYCITHKCWSCGNKKIDNGSYCIEHTCSKYGCTTDKQYDSEYCMSHTCLAGLCKQETVSGGQYCEEHTCVVAGCLNQKLLNDYCYYHTN